MGRCDLFAQNGLVVVQLEDQELANPMLSLKSAAYKQRSATFFHSKSEFGSAVQLVGNEYLLGGPGKKKQFDLRQILN